MKILVLSHCLPYPPNKGDKIRAFHELKHLAKNHEVHLLALGDRDEISKYTDDLKELCHEVELFPLNRTMGSIRSMLGVFRRRPLTVSFFRSRDLARRVSELNRTASFDLVLAYTSAMVPYARQIENTPRALDMVDVDSIKWARYASFASFPQHLIYHLEARRMQRFEASTHRWFDKVLLTTEREVEILKSVAPKTSTSVVRNGVNLQRFRRFELPRSEAPTLLFMGQMDYFANVDGVCHFARNIFPKLRQRIPDLQFVVVGRAPAPKVLSLEEIPGVAVTGTVSDVRPFLARANVFVAPLRIAQGVQNKVLEAMASELPVVCTPTVRNGIADGGFSEGEHLLVAKSDREFEEALVQLLENRELASKMSEAALAQLSKAHSWDDNMSGFEEILRSIAEPREALSEEAQIA